MEVVKRRTEEEEEEDEWEEEEEEEAGDEEERLLKCFQIRFDGGRSRGLRRRPKKRTRTNLSEKKKWRNVLGRLSRFWFSAILLKLRDCPSVL